MKRLQKIVLTAFLVSIVATGANAQAYRCEDAFYLEDPVNLFTKFQNNAFIDEDAKFHNPPYLRRLTRPNFGNCGVFDQEVFDQAISTLRDEKLFLETEFGFRVSSIAVTDLQRDLIKRVLVPIKPSTRADRMAAKGAVSATVGIVTGVGVVVLTSATGGTAILIGGLASAATAVLLEAFKKEIPQGQLTPMELITAMEGAGNIEVWLRRMNGKEQTNTLLTYTYLRNLGEAETKRYVLYQMLIPDATFR